MLIAKLIFKILMSGQAGDPRMFFPLNPFSGKWIFKYKSIG